MGVLDRCLDWLEALRQQEPHPEGRLANFVESVKFRNLMASVILANLIHISVVIEYSITTLSSEEPVVLRAIEICFLLAYSFEMVVKLAVHRWYFFIGRDWAWNSVDLSLTLFQATDVITGFAVPVSSRPNLLIWRTM